MTVTTSGGNSFSVVMRGGQGYLALPVAATQITMPAGGTYPLLLGYELTTVSMLAAPTGVSYTWAPDANGDPAKIAITFTAPSGATSMGLYWANGTFVDLTTTSSPVTTAVVPATTSGVGANAILVAKNSAGTWGLGAVITLTNMTRLSSALTSNSFAWNASSSFGTYTFTQVSGGVGVALTYANGTVQVFNTASSPLVFCPPLQAVDVGSTTTFTAKPIDSNGVWGSTATSNISITTRPALVYNGAATTFTSSGTYTASGNKNLAAVIVAGGGGGGGGYIGGGGGAGGFYWVSGLFNGSVPVVVGTGGTAGVQVNGSSQYSNAKGGNGSNSTFGDSSTRLDVITGHTLTAIGGGGGAATDTQQAAVPGQSGGSGGGGGAYSPGQSGGSGTSGQGNNGGSATGPYLGGGGTTICSGGGGAGAAGGNSYGSWVGGTGTDTAGNGGAGKSTSITGSAQTFAGGGGGGSDYSGTRSSSAGSGGTGGGGQGRGGYLTNYAGSAGTANTGGGGGGGGNTSATAGSYTPGFAGGSGIVIVRELA
jgi:hypothetical protein